MSHTQIFQDTLPGLLWLFQALLVVGCFYAGLLIFRAKKLDPLPMLPLAGAMFALQTGLRVITLWIGFHHEFTSGPISMRLVFQRIIGDPVFLLTAGIFTALLVHTLLHAFAAARTSVRKRRWTLETRLAFHCVLLSLVLCFAVAQRIFTAMYLTPIRQHPLSTIPSLPVIYQSQENAPHIPLQFQFWEEEDVFHLFE